MRARDESLWLCTAVLLAGCYTTLQESIHEDTYSATYRQPFGHVSFGLIPYSSFFGEIEGVESGFGVTVYVPPLLPVQTVGVVGVVAAPILLVGAIAAGDGDAAAAVLDGWEDCARLATIDPRMGVSDALRDVTRNVISDISMDLGFAISQHKDSLFGGKLLYTGVLLGLRLAGPREKCPRIYGCGGMGWYWFDYDNRPDASIPGPYAGIGMEFVDSQGRSAVGFEVRASFYFGDDEAGVPVDGGSIQAFLDLGVYW